MNAIEKEGYLNFPKVSCSFSEKVIEIIKPESTEYLIFNTNLGSEETANKVNE